MNIHDYIDSQTRNNEDQKLKSKPKFQKVKKTEKIIKSPRGIGERPLIMDTSNTDSSNSKKSSKQEQAKKKKDIVFQQTSQQPNSGQKNESIEANGNCNSDENKFAGIIPSVREVSGGWNTQSNEVIERRYRNRRQKLTQDSSDVSNLSLDATHTSFSSETTDSYKTAAQDSFKSRSFNEQQKTSMVIKDNPLERYKKNALIKGLLQDAANNYPDKDESSTECSSSDFMDASSISDIQSGMQILTIEPDEESMREDRIARLYQSREDEDVFVHPLREEIRYDPEWQNVRLKRKGIEITQTPRNYYMNLDDDGFTFSSK